MSKYRDFQLDEVLYFATGGRVCAPQHREDISPVIDVAAYMVGRSVHPSGLRGIAKMCQDVVLGQHPSLRTVAHRVQAGELDALYRKADGDERAYQASLANWLELATQLSGKRFTLVPLTV